MTTLSKVGRRLSPEGHALVSDYRNLVSRALRESSIGGSAVVRLRQQLGTKPYVLPGQLFRDKDKEREYRLAMERLMKRYTSLRQPERAVVELNLQKAVRGILELPKVAAKAPAPSTPLAARSGRAAPPRTAGRKLVMAKRGGAKRPAIGSVKLAAKKGVAKPTRAGRETKAAKASPPRWINAEIEGYEKSQPLLVGTPYPLSFDVDIRQRKGAVGSAPFAFDFPPGVNQVELSVQLESDDFDVSTHVQPLTVGRAGPSLNKARFQITPRHEGTGRLTAIVHKDGNVIQVLKLEIAVGSTTGAKRSSSRLTMTRTGRPLAAIGMANPRQISLLVEEEGEHYVLTMTKPYMRAVRLGLDKRQLASRIEELRKKLLEVVNQKVDADGKKNGRRVFQDAIDIPQAYAHAAMQSLAALGYHLFYDLFLSANAGSATREVGEMLRQALRAEQCRVQVTSRNFPVPWAMMYLATDFSEDKPADPKLFLGLRHILEQNPDMEAGWANPVIPSDHPTLHVSLNVNREIDAEFKGPYVSQQIAYWQQFPHDRVECVVRDTGREFATALQKAADDQLLYLYCHAASPEQGEGEGADDACLVFEGNTRLTLRELKERAPKARTLRKAPLVVINACESAAVSPLMYDGLLPYFIVKGARGVIGTECSVPALFASEWARRFFESFLAGKSLGEALLELRQEFLHKHNNILGLLYEAYCDGDSRVAPAVTA